MKSVFAICGSTRSTSSNLSLLRALKNLASDIFEINIFTGIAEIPHFNPDLDNDHPPQEVILFRKKLNAADGILICTPEYAMGVPGTLKNAIDWTVSSSEFSHKPTALITASSLGEKGHASLLETLKIIEADISDETALLISHIKMKISPDGDVHHKKTLEDILNLLGAFKIKMGLIDS
jgi:NAD(P)H-dependent FMN reductase